MEAHGFDSLAGGFDQTPAVGAVLSPAEWVETGAVEVGAPASISGIEQEYAVWRDGRQVPFAPLLGAILPHASARGFGEDPLARVRRDGAVWTADGPHAETVTPPRRLGLGIASQLADDVLHQREMLLRRLRSVGAQDGAPYELRGYSTHVNAFCRTADPWTLVRRFGELYGPAVMLLADRRDSPGLLIRPRPDRLEIGTEYLESRDDIEAVVLVVLSATIDLWNAVAAEPGSGGDPASNGALRRLYAGAFQSTWQRPGIFIDRAAFGDDMYRRGRDAWLRLADGGRERAGQRLENSWVALRPIASTFATEAELSAVDTRVAGAVKLPSERLARLEPTVHRGHRIPRVSPGPNAMLLGRMRHGALRVEPAALDWDASLLRISHRGGVAFARVPRDDSARFASMVRNGDLAVALEARAVVGGPPAVTSPEDRTPGLFDVLVATDGEVARLLGPGGTEMGRAATGSSVVAATSAAFGARKLTVEPMSTTSGRVPRRGLAWLGLGAAAVGIVLVSGLLLASGRLTGTGTLMATPSPSASPVCPAGAAAAPCSNANASGASNASGLPSSTASPTTSLGVSPSAGQCALGAVCPSGPSGPSATPCPAGIPCATRLAPTARPTVRPTRAPTPRPTRAPTPSPTFCNPAAQPCAT